MNRALFVTFLVATAAAAACQGNPPLTQPRLNNVVTLKLDHQTIFDALAMVQNQGVIAISIETIPTSGFRDKVNNPPISIVIGPTSISEAMDQLVALDPRYAWTSEEGRINVFPKSSISDSSYFMTTSVAKISLKGSKTVSEAVTSAASQVPHEAISIFAVELGSETVFPRTLEVTFTDVTLRKVLNYVAEELGPTFGWQMFGPSKYRTVIFHSSLLVSSPATNAGAVTGTSGSVKQHR